MIIDEMVAVLTNNLKAQAVLYIGEEEIGAFEHGIAKELKIPGKSTPVAIEIKGTEALKGMKIVGWKNISMDFSIMPIGALTF